MELVLEIYSLTEQFPKEEIYGLVSQMRRSAVSIPSNIAEGRLRGYRKEFRQFLLIAFGSGGELETQIEIAERLPKTSNRDYIKARSLLEEEMRMLNVMVNKLRFPASAQKANHPES